MFKLLTLFFFVLFIGSGHLITQDDIGIKLVLTQPGLSELLLIIDESLTELANELEPLYIEALPPIIKPGMELNLSNITLFETSHSSLAGIILPGNGLQAVMKGAEAQVTFNMKYNITQGRIKIIGSDFVQMNISDTEISLILNITAMEDGNPLVNLTNTTVAIGSFVFKETGDWEQLEPTISALLEDFLETQLPAQLTAKVNEFLYNFTSQLQLDEIDLTKGTAVNLTLPNNPYTTDSLTLIGDFRGFAYIPSDGIYGFYHGCASPMSSPIDAKYSFSSRMVQLALSDQVANCLSETLFVSYQLNFLVQQIFNKFLDALSPGPLQKGMDITLSCLLPPTITSSSKTGITIDIPAEMTWIRSPPLYPVAEPYISLYTNLSVTLWANIENDFLYLNISSFKLVLGTAWVSESMPENYAQQVKNTPWLKLNSYLQAILNTLLPVINAKLAGGFLLPPLPTERITVGMADLKIKDGYIVISASFVGKDK